MSTRIPEIWARRIAGDLYECTAPRDTLNAQLRWADLCELALSSQTRKVCVNLRLHRAEDELPMIEYFPSQDCPLSAMVSPAQATEPEIRTRRKETVSDTLSVFREK